MLAALFGQELLCPHKNLTVFPYGAEIRSLISYRLTMFIILVAVDAYGDRKITAIFVGVDVFGDPSTLTLAQTP